MTVRALESRDFPDLLALLKLQDEDAAHRSMTPESRSVEELALELGELSPYSELVPLVLESDAGLTAYVALCRYDGEAFLEGPLMHPEASVEEVKPLVLEATAEAKRRGFAFVEAFVDEENRRAQQVLSEAAFEPFRTTYIYTFTRGTPLAPLAPSPFRFERTKTVDLSSYRDLYRETSDNWATRLAWRDEDLLERFADPNVTLTLAYRGDKLVGHLELERFPDEGYAEVAYFGVLPEARGQKLGRELLLRGLHEAFADEAIEQVLARAQDDERAASFALEGVGFRLSHGVVAFTLELEP
ncbi:GNAT family N-acetyltransferase [Truepera radiovictrix]|uniref:GCN5-related N-acetyltransferase n=1 Tax=Truepera radiovictrix (strain DSM 17093 / CIP 108686 / LMG 22925 / RQ-24) TaxID=649638 RepID=D7CQT1_TRURR|nr:GNAT family N-acetyltransferase [Truepera radiovictrix]ADI15065.1 GCN5-related N-acetyltransferase [Truepera radiovictrix DSM 17093]WMT56382.1 GNAT family N-acetyltransferase [Truepera radiovictrix]